MKNLTYHALKIKPEIYSKRIFDIVSVLCNVYVEDLNLPIATTQIVYFCKICPQLQVQIFLNFVVIQIVIFNPIISSLEARLLSTGKGKIPSYVHDMFHLPRTD